jgi:hypothetical protein
MLKQTFIAAAAASLMVFGATDAFAGKGGGGHGGGYGGGGKYGGEYYGGRHYGGHYGYGWYRYPSWGFTNPYPRCRYQPRKVRIKVWDRRGRLYYKWVWRDVKVC